MYNAQITFLKNIMDKESAVRGIPVCQMNKMKKKSNVNEQDIILGQRTEGPGSKVTYKHV